MKLTLNPYVVVINADGEYNLFLSDYEKPIKLTPDATQAQMLESMNKGAFYDYEHLCEKLDKHIVDKLMQSGCLVPNIIDTQSIFSRTNAFFLTHNMPEARERLSKKKVLILGCGGIGTHMAWHMATLGVAQITLVDFDKVEISNLNRQLLFDCNDAGSIKADVLKSKLQNVNPEILIKTICKKIDSENDLESICLSENYDLIIKALDSPADFPIWLDNVAKRNNLSYIAGITMHENVLIGPSYIPGTSCYGWSDLMDIKANTAYKVFGTAPSLGIMLYHISDELAIEAFKILTGYGKPKYADKILCRNIITDEEQYIQKDQEVKNNSKHNKSTYKAAFILNFILMVVLAISQTQVGWLVLPSLVIAMVTPFIIFKSNQDVVRCTFVNSTVVVIGILIRYISTINMSTPTALISSIVLLFGIHSAVTLFACVINYFIYKIFYKATD